MAAVLRTRRQPAESSEDLQTGYLEANSRIFCRVTKDQGLDIMEGSVPTPKRKKDLLAALT
jgi:hypothetical protein